MMIPIPSRGTRFTIHLRIVANSPLKMGIVVFDPTASNTDYFRRSVTFKESAFNTRELVERTIQIPLPVTPQNLVLEVYNKHFDNDVNFKVEKLEIKPMPPKEVWATSPHHRFMEFAIDFAQKAGHVKAGFYNSPDNEFLIQYLPKITDEFGEELVTPARISRKMPRVQLSRKTFRQFSIPVRIAILSHEGCHFFQNTRSEKQADLCGIKYYLDYGFPEIEAVYAATKVFGMHPESIGVPHLNRTRDIMSIIDQAKHKKNRKTHAA